MITPRATRLVRAADLHVYRAAVSDLAFGGEPADVRNRLVVVPTGAAARLLVSAAERRPDAAGSALVHPEFTTSGQLAARFAERVLPLMQPARPEAREILMGVAGREAVDASAPAPFALRPGLVAEMLAFYDAVRRRRRDVATFERLTLGRLEPGAEYDRGAERLVRQTRFLAAAFRAFERLQTMHGVIDEHVLRERAIAQPSDDPWLHVVVAVGDDARDPHGLSEADWDLLTRVPRLQRLDVVVTDRCLAGPWHERIHELLPGLAEVRWEAAVRPRPVLRVPMERTRASQDRVRHLSGMARDREDEVADFARWVRRLRREDPGFDLERSALIVGRPLPYVYLARTVMESAHVACQAFDSLPLAAEPPAGALELLFTVISSRTSRTAGVALLRSPHFEWIDGKEIVQPEAIAAVDRFLGDAGYLGGTEALVAIVAQAESDPGRRRAREALPALRTLARIAAWVEDFESERAAAEHLARLIAFVEAHAPTSHRPTERLRRAGMAMRAVLTTLRDEYSRLDEQPVSIDRVVAVIRRWIDAHTFAPRVAARGSHVVDPDSARFGDFDCVQLAGLVEGEWPARGSGSIFYGSSILRDLGWSAEAERTDYARASFVDLLLLPATAVTVSTFQLEDDALVRPSPLLEELERFGLDVAVDDSPDVRVLEVEALGLEPVVLDGLDASVRSEVDRRLTREDASSPRYHGEVTGHAVTAYSLSGLERYQDCPFLFFARDVLRLPELVEDEPFLSPRARGRFIHEVCERFFRAWDSPRVRSISSESLGEARAVFLATAEPLLAGLSPSDAALERARLFGSAISTGIVDVLLALEAGSSSAVVDRWLEHRFDGMFALGQAGSRLPLRGIADRIDLLDGRRLRVVDYKSGRAPSAARALQVPIYALCALDVLEERDGPGWGLEEALYVSFSGRRVVTSVVTEGAGVDEVLDAARERLVAVVTGVEGGSFPPRPHDTTLCRTCAYGDVCRKDYVHG